MILTGSQQVAKVSDVYPKGDYNEIFDKLVKSGLEPFGVVRERGNSDKEKKDKNKISIHQKKLRKQSENDKEFVSSSKLLRKKGNSLDVNNIKRDLDGKTGSEVSPILAVQTNFKLIEDSVEFDKLDLKSPLQEEIKEADDDEECSP